MMHSEIILTCEHATNRIPENWNILFGSHPFILDTHRGIDFGASELADYLSKSLGCVCIQASVSRLLIDCNRSIGHQHCFSEFTRNIDEKEKHEIIQSFYLPYRRAVEHSILEDIKEGNIVHHFSIHSFTPVLNHITRKTDIGLLYDPGRRHEKKIALALKKNLEKMAPEFRVRMNYPYLGINNSFTKVLRRLFTDDVYTGVEIEVNQSITGHSVEDKDNLITFKPSASFETLKRVLAEALDNL